MAGYTYTTYKSAVQTLVASNSGDTDFDAIFPSGIDYAEQRLYRELNLISTVQTDTSTTLTPSTRTASILNTFVAVNNINLLTPAGSDATSGIRVPLVAVSRDLLDTLWPSNSTVGQPAMFAMITQWTIIVGPSPDGAYQLEVVGTFRPDPISAANPTTFLSLYLPDLLVAATMVFMSGYMRNFGTQSSDPQMAMSWEQQYQTLFKSANTEELRKRYWASSWSSQPNSTEASNQRG